MKNNRNETTNNKIILSLEEVRNTKWIEIKGKLSFIQCQNCLEYRLISAFQVKRILNGAISKGICKSCSNNRKKHKRKYVGYTYVNGIREEYKIKGCVMVETKEIKRCDDYLTCPYYLDCLNVAYQKGWKGWTSK